MTSNIRNTIKKLMNYEVSLNILDKFTNEEKLKIMNKIIFSNEDYNCKNLELMKELYKKQEIIK